MDEKRYRVTVQSAEEAVKVLKKNFDGRAKVLSVRQIEGRGLIKFLSKPKLEIIVSVSNEVKATLTPGMVSRPTQVIKQEVVKRYETLSSKCDTNVFIPRIELQKLLVQSGFDPLLVQDFFFKNPSLKDDTWQKNLNLFLQYLQSTYNQLVFKPITNRVVFMGPSGVGKTLALCKILAQEVFIDQHQPCVIQLNGEQPKGQEALELFCDILNVPFVQECLQPLPEPSMGQRYFFDYEGIDFNSPEEISHFNCKLNKQGIETRVLVLNSLYDTSFLDLCFEQAARLNATHCVFTHMDETINIIKLWKYVLKGDLSPYFLSYGQNLTSDYTQQVFSFLLDKTLSRLS